MGPDQDDVTDVPTFDASALGDPPTEQESQPSGGASSGSASGGRRRRNLAGDPLEGPPLDRSAGDRISEAQMVRTFYWLYKGWCKVLGAQVDAKKSDFDDLGRAWIELARRVPGIRWLVALAGPLFTLTDLIDKLAVAWTARTRLRDFSMSSWRQRNQHGQEQTADPGVHVVADGPARAS